MSDDIKDIEHRAYCRGYQAGRKRQKVDRDNERRLREGRAFRDRAFLAALQGLLATSKSWTRGGKPVKNSEHYAALAWDLADEAVRQRGPTA